MTGTKHEGRDEPSIARWLRQEPFDERSARMEMPLGGAFF